MKPGAVRYPFDGGDGGDGSVDAMKPFFKYFGSKYTIAKLHLPPEHDLIIEPFAGSACYSVVHGAGKRVYLYDVNEDVIALWKWLRDATVSEIKSLPVDELQEGQDIRDVSPSYGAALFIRGWQRVGRSNCWTVSKWGSPMIRAQLGYADNGLWSKSVKRRLLDQQPMIQKWKFFRKDYSEIDVNRSATWFIDPPYQLQPASLYGTPKLNYRKLGNWCKRLDGQIIVCENEGADWLPFTPLCDGLYRNAHGNAGKKMKEMTWMRG